MLISQWRLLFAIQGSRNGLSIERLIQESGVARATVYRYLETLMGAGAPIQADTTGGQVRYRFLRASELPPMGFNALQIAALHLARLELQPLAGAAVVRELDTLLEKLCPPAPQQSFSFGKHHRSAGHPEILKTIETALHLQRRARIEYRAASRGGTSTSLHIEPLIFKVAEGEPYLRAYCVERAAERTYKMARIARAELTEQAATYRPPRAPAEAFAHSVKAWSDHLTTVRIKLDPDVAWRAQEYPLIPGQTIEGSTDGGVIIAARVAGIVEAKRWVLSWGGAAEALEPPELRAATQTELVTALAKYGGPGPAKAATKRKSTARETSRLANGGTRRA